MIAKLTYVQLLSIVALNCLPLVGVLAFDWSIFHIVFVYWLENVVIGVYTALRMLVRGWQTPGDFAFPFLTAFFCVHYGFFCFGHGTFVVALFGDTGLRSLVGVVTDQLANVEVLAAFIALCLMQAYRALNQHRHQVLTVQQLMTAPYKRIVVLHIAIIGSGFAVTAMAEPVLGLVLLVALKVGFDLFAASRDEVPDKQPLTQKLEPAAR